MPMTVNTEADPEKRVTLYGLYYTQADPEKRVTL